jgi:hypothetical protein
LEVNAQVPNGTGEIVNIKWDVDGSGRFSALPGSNVSFDTPGTYFPTVRVTSERHGDATTLFA